MGMLNSENVKVNTTLLTYREPGILQFLFARHSLGFLSCFSGHYLSVKRIETASSYDQKHVEHPINENCCYGFMILDVQNYNTRAAVIRDLIKIHAC